MAIEFEIATRRVDGATPVVTVSGEIDLFTVPEFKEHVGAAIDGGATHLVVDLSDTSFIDSSSLGVLIGAHRRLAARNGTLSVVCSSDAIVKTFRITGLDGVLRLADTLEEALSTPALDGGS